MIRIPVRQATCVGLALLGWAGALLGDGSDQWLTMIFILWGVAAGVVAYPMLRRVRLPGRGRRAIVVVSEVRQDYFTMFWMWVERHVPRIRRTRERYAAILRRVGAGTTYDYDLHARRATHLALTLAPLVSLPVIFGEIMLVPVAAAPAVFIYPLMQLWSRVRQHAVQAKEEMSFFLCYLSTMQGVGYTLYMALGLMRNAPDVFVAMSRDATAVTCKVMLGTPHMTVLREYAANHPVQQFRDFLHGYISKHETVGSVPSYTEAKSEQFFESYSQTWNNYKASAIMMAGMAVMVSVMIPIMMVMMVFISTQSTVNTIFTLGPIMGPVFSLLLLFMVSSSQPSTGVKMKPWLPSIGVGVAVAVLVHMLWMSMIPGDNVWDTEPGVTISLGFVAAGLSNYLMVRRQLSGSSNVDRGLPEFLEDVTEQTMAGSSITTILRQQARSGIYTGQFGMLLRGIVSKIEAGMSMEDACHEARKHSRYLAFTLFIIIWLKDIGSTSPTVLQQMTKFMAGIVTTKMDVIKSLRIGAVMIYTAPVMLMAIMNMMFVMFSADTVSTSTLANVLPPGMMDGFAPPDPDSGYKQRLGMLGALLTCPMGLVAAKITKFTSVDTMPVVIIGVVNVVAITAIPIVLEALPV